jgi:PAS domain S-box-containing protein
MDKVMDGLSLRPLWTGLALILLPSVALVGVETYEVAHNVPRLEASQALVDHTIRVLTTADALRRAVLDAERGQRGFLITGNEAYLAPYQSGVRQVPPLLSELERLTADNPEQQRRWPNLERQLKVKLNELKRTIDVRRTEGFEAARRIVETDVGQEAMRSIETTIDAAVASERILLRRRRTMGDAAERAAAAASALGIALATAVIALGVLQFVRFLRRLSKSQGELRESERRFRLMVSGIKDYALFMLDRDGRVVTWNQGAEHLKGYEAQEIIGRHFSCFYSREDIEAGMPERLLATAIREGSASVEGWRLRKDGSRFWASVLITPIRDDSGALQGFAKLTRDITERVETEAALARERHDRERSEEILRHSQKMDALGQLTGGIAHDFNNMLGVIIGSLEILQRRLQSDDAGIGDPIRLAMEAADRSASLTHRLLAFSRRQPLAPQPVDANKLVSGMSNLLHRTVGEGTSLETVLAAGLWLVSADVHQLESALLNLSLNARDAMPDGGKLTIETANAYLDTAYAAAHSEVTEGQYVMIAITDTGAGMPADIVNRAFEPFFTTKAVGEGTGLGLSQVYGFVKQSSGHIKIYSEPGNGTTVRLYLPRFAGDSVDGRRLAAVSSAAPDTRLKTILVVEDNELVRESTAEILEQQGYGVLLATDGAAALQMLGSPERDIQMLFTDVGLPGGLNGRQLADEAKRLRPGLKVLFTTGYARNAIIHQGRLDPGVEFIAKPFTYSALSAKIRQVMDKES